MRPQSSRAAWPLSPLPASSVTTRLSCTSGTPEAVTLESTCAGWRCWAWVSEQGMGPCWWWRKVTGTADPGTQAPAHQRFESGELPEEDSETDLSPRLPAAHLIGAWTTGQGLGWEAKKEEAFLSSGTQFSGAEGLALPQDGLYYLYCHIGYRGRAPPPAVEPLDGSVTLLSRLYRAGGAYGSGTPELLLEGAETVTPVSDPARRHDYGPLWYTSVGFGGLVQLRRGERVYVNISHPDMVDYRRGKTFFGAVMVG
uniref:Lymphotoxin-beta n=1 Tax=Bos taurus TaxID=9913 RepID=A0AAA9TLX3_BOVIN